MKRAAIALLLLSACGAPGGRAVVGLKPLSLGETKVEVVNATGRELPVPRPGVVDEISQLASGEARAVSVADAFSSAVAAGLRERGIETVNDRSPARPVFRVTLLDFEIRNHDTAGAVAFVSAKYRMADAKNGALWEAEERRLPIRLGGPDLTRSEIVRIASQAVDHALASFPVTIPSGRFE